jgi:hypothetical protein
LKKTFDGINGRVMVKVSVLNSNPNLNPNTKLKLTPNKNMENLLASSCINSKYDIFS